MVSISTLLMQSSFFAIYLDNHCEAVNTVQSFRCMTECSDMLQDLTLSHIVPHGLIGHTHCCTTEYTKHINQRIEEFQVEDGIDGHDFPINRFVVN